MVKNCYYELKGTWVEYVKAWIQNKEFKDNLSIYGFSDKEFKYRYGLYRIQANRSENKDVKYDIKLLTGDRKDMNYPIVALICWNDYQELIVAFDEKGKSFNNEWELSLEYTHFDKGDYVVTDTGTIGILAHNEWIQCGIWSDGKEFMTSNSNGIPVRLCNENECKKIDDLLFVYNKKLNEETKVIEDV